MAQGRQREGFGTFKAMRSIPVFIIFVSLEKAALHTAFTGYPPTLTG
jgi:hypothetical protein